MLLLKSWLKIYLTRHPFPRVFSRCSKRDLDSYFQKGGGMCLYNMPNMKDLVGGKKCGNGFVEDGEECDCGEPDVSIFVNWSFNCPNFKYKINGSNASVKPCLHCMTLCLILYLLTKAPDLNQMCIWLLCVNSFKMYFKRLADTLLPLTRFLAGKNSNR